jgi:hypothetical protein
VSELLHNLGLSYQKARFVSDHLDETARQRGLPILFGDEVSFIQWGSLSYIWVPKSCQAQVETSGIRKGYKVCRTAARMD